MPEVVAGRYRLVDRLGQGGMGVVWRAHDEFLDRQVAIKEVTGQDEPAALRAVREAKAAARLRHPGIITVHDVVVDDGRPWIVMELVAGRSLAAVLEQDSALPEERVAAIAGRLLDALQVAHAHGILHRDVKPGNVLLDGDRVVLTDFGIAAIDGATALTGTNAVIGSPLYIAPERIQGQAASPAADLWSLGITLYLALEGRNPFQRADLQASLAAVLAQEPTPPRTGARLWPLIQGLLRKNPAARLTAAQARTLLTGQTPQRRSSRKWWAGAAGLLVVVAAVVVGLAVPKPKLAGTPVAAATTTPGGSTVAANGECAISAIKVETRSGVGPKITLPTGCVQPTTLQTVDLGQASPEAVAVKAGDTFSVHYTLVTWSDGQVAESTPATGQPFKVEALGSGKLIKGWEQGLVGMRRGAPRLLVVPPSMAYGDQGVGKIKPNETLVFVVSVVG